MSIRFSSKLNRKSKKRIKNYSPKNKSDEASDKDSEFSDVDFDEV